MNERICLVGLGYVGLTLAIVLEEEFKTVGLDINADQI